MLTSHNSFSHSLAGRLLNQIIGGVCLATAALLASPPAAMAEVFHVPDGGVAGLIAAINAANANGEADVITLGHLSASYTLTSVDNHTYGGNGLPSITSEITIQSDEGWKIERLSDPNAPDFRIFHSAEARSCITAPTSTSGDPLLGLLADNSGPTQTHELLPGSIAIDAGDCAGGAVTTDQRGIDRPRRSLRRRTPRADRLKSPIATPRPLR